MGEPTENENEPRAEAETQAKAETQLETEVQAESQADAATQVKTAAQVEAESPDATERQDAAETQVESQPKVEVESPVEADVMVEVTRCGNCGVTLLGQYCSDCGQEDRVVPRPFWRIIKQLLHAVFELDGRVYRSLYYLYTRPGFLSTEYLSGRRARYTPPLRMFLVLSISFFLIVSLVGTFAGIFGDAASLRTATTSGDDNPSTQLGPAQPIRELLADDAEDNGLGELDFDPQEIRVALEEMEVNIPFLTAATSERLTDFMVEQAVSNFIEARENPLEFFRGFIGESLEYVTIFILLMMPMLALVQWVLFIVKGRYYVEHFILTLHNHSFLIVSAYLMALTGLIANRIPMLEGLIDWVDFILVMWVLIYLFLSLKNFYRVGYVYSGLVFLTATAIYGALTMTGLAIFLTIAFLLY